MAILDSELARIKFHCGYNLLSVGAEPYIGHAAIWDVVQDNLSGGAATTSATTVAAATTPTPVTLTLTSATGFAAGNAVIVDVDSRQERATVQAVSGATITVLLSFAHTGTYAVTVEGGESVVRGLLKSCDAALTAYESAITSAGIKQLGRGEIEWFGDGNGSRGLLSSAKRALDAWRDELASALGVRRMNAPQGGAMTTLY